MCVCVLFFKLYWQQQYFFPIAQMIAAKKEGGTLALTERYFICARDKNTIFWRLPHGGNKGCVAKSVSNI